MSSPRIAIELPTARIDQFCRRHHIVRLALFGSVLREDFSQESDVDVLVEFAPGKTPGLSFFAIQEELSQVIGRRVDLNTPAWLGRLRERVVKEAVVLYDAA